MICVSPEEYSEKRRNTKVSVNMTKANRTKTPLEGYTVRLSFTNPNKMNRFAKKMTNGEHQTIDLVEGGVFVLCNKDVIVSCGNVYLYLQP